MKKVFKWLGILILLIVILAASGIGYISFFKPDVGDAPDIKVAITPERVQRGDYLANSVMVCMDCHSQRDWSQFSGPLVPGTLGSGGERFDRKMGFPGDFIARNITPHNLGNWTDGEIYRAITTGVSKDGHALFPIMPYQYYGTLDTEDIYSVIAYVRSLPPIENNIEPSKADFPFSVILRTIPVPAKPEPRPATTDVVAHGKYLVRASGCIECHTKVDDKNVILPDVHFAGGREFPLPGGVIRTPNITPDATGIGAWSREQFVGRFKMYVDSNYHSPKLAMTDFNTLMPWTMYGRMTVEDLSAIYAYLRTVKPIKNTVEKFTPGGKMAMAE